MSKIEWTGKTWNPIVGCSIVSPGCTNCYAMRMAARLEAMAGVSRVGHAVTGMTETLVGPTAHYAGTTKRVNGKPVWTGKVALAPERVLLEPLRRRKPTTYFVNSMGDLFHESVPGYWIDTVFAVMALCPQHTFQVLTKRASRMRSYFDNDWEASRQYHVAVEAARMVNDGDNTLDVLSTGPWPLPNVWLGVSAERQQEAAERIPDLLATPAVVRFVSAEPLLGPIDFRALPRKSAAGFLRPLDGRFNRLDWIIVGGESGPSARACWVPHVRSLVDQCRRAGVPVFVKQLGRNVQDRNDAGFDGCDPDEWPEHILAEDRIEDDLSGYHDGYQGAPVRIHLRHPKGGDPAEWPADLRVRMLPGASYYDQSETDPHHGGKVSTP